MTRAERLLRTSQRASAVYDLVAVTPFALPGVARWQLGQLRHTAATLSLSGDLPEFAPAHLFFVNVFGIFVVVWSILRLKRTEPVFALCDAILRFSFAATMLFYALAENATHILLVFAAFEVFWGTFQGVAYARWRSSAERG